MQTAFSGYALFELSWFMTHKSRLRRDNPPSRHDWPSLSFSFVFARDSPCEETVLAYCFQAFKALGEQAGCLLSQCAVASLQTFTNIRGTFAVIYVPPKRVERELP